MAGIRETSSEIRDFILNNVVEHPRDITTFTSEHFGLSRQAVTKHLRGLIDVSVLEASGHTKGRSYTLRTFVNESMTLDVTPQLEEDSVWREFVLPHMDGLEPNVIDICQYGFTEMLNNVIEHSNSQQVQLEVGRNAVRVFLAVRDFGIGIFKKIQADFALTDPRHALLELSKGKLTSEREAHTGEGIFFTSRMFDEFEIFSGDLYFSRTNADADDWLIEVDDQSVWQGTTVFLEIHPRSGRHMREVFDKYTGGFDYDFSRTHVPIKLVRYGKEQLVSRSQARRVLARFDRFNEVSLDFQGIDTIGHSFADEIFRVYRNQHPEITLVPLRTTPAIDHMIARAWDSD